MTRPLAEPVLSVVGERVALGPLRRELYPLHLAWVNDPEVGWNIFGSPQSRTLEEESAWLDRESADPANRLFLIYARELESWRPIGVTSLTAIGDPSGTATFRILIGSQGDRGNGYGTEATCLALSLAFDKLGVHRVLLTVFGWNDRAVRLYERAGFHVTGRRPAGVLRDGRSWDRIVMDCEASRFRRVVAARDDASSCRGDRGT